MKSGDEKLIDPNVLYEAYKFGLMQVMEDYEDPFDIAKYASRYISRPPSAKPVPALPKNDRFLHEIGVVVLADQRDLKEVDEYLRSKEAELSLILESNLLSMYDVHFTPSGKTRQMANNKAVRMDGWTFDPGQTISVFSRVYIHCVPLFERGQALAVWEISRTRELVNELVDGGYEDLLRPYQESNRDHFPFLDKTFAQYRPLSESVMPKQPDKSRVNDFSDLPGSGEFS